MRNGRLPRSPRWRSLSWEDKMRTLKSPTQERTSFRYCAHPRAACRAGVRRAQPGGGAAARADGYTAACNRCTYCGATHADRSAAHAHHGAARTHRGAADGDRHTRPASNTDTNNRGSVH